MKIRFALPSPSGLGLLLGGLVTLGALPLAAESPDTETPGAAPLVVVNTLADRPVLSWSTPKGVVTRSVAPGQKIALEATGFSGLGDKNVAVQGGQTYYLARFRALPALYRLARGQVLVVNQAGRPVAVTLGQARGLLANGTPALGELGPDGTLTVGWDDAQAAVKAGGVYRLVVASPEGLGTTVVLTPWD